MLTAGLLSDHLRHCVLDASRAPGGADDALAEIPGTIRQVVRL